MGKYELKNINQSEFALMFAPKEKGTQRGCIGYLRADFDKGKSFFSNWFDETSELKVQDFKKEFDEVINYFRESTSAPLLRSREDMKKVCNELKPTVYDGDNEIRGFKVETSDYTYYLKCTPRQGRYDLYCYCYNTEQLTQYLKSQSIENSPENKQENLTARQIELVASYEEGLEVPENERTTAYFGDLALHYIKHEIAPEHACEIKDKALDILRMTQEEFDNREEFSRKSIIKGAVFYSLQKFKCISECADKNYLFRHLSVPDLDTVENVLQAYKDGKIDLDIPRDADSGEIDFDGEFNLIIKDESYREIGMEVTVLKWYESLEDTGYMVQAVGSEIYSYDDEMEQTADEIGGISM